MSGQDYMASIGLSKVNYGFDYGKIAIAIKEMIYVCTYACDATTLWGTV